MGESYSQRNNGSLLMSSYVIEVPDNPTIPVVTRRFPSDGSSLRVSMPVGFSGERNSRFAQQVADRLSATTPFNGYVYQVKTQKPAWYTAYYLFGQKTYNWRDNVSAGYHLVYDPKTSLTTAADNAARTRFYQKMSTSFSGPTVLGELRETLQMIRKPAIGLRRGLNAYTMDAVRIRSRSRKLSDYSKSVSELWLEYRFGWKPLISDIESGFDAFSKRLYDIPIEKFRIREKRTSSETLRRSINSTPYSYDGVDLNIVREDRYTSTAQYIGAIYTPITSQSSIPASLGFVPEEFVPVAWELMPYSFLIDYFVNIGDILQATYTASRLRYVYCQLTTRGIVTSRVTTESKIRPGFSGIVEQGTAEAVSKLVSRQSVSSVPIPGLTVSTTLGTFRALNIGALFNLRREDSRLKRRGK